MDASNFGRWELIEQWKAFFIESCFENKDFIAADIGIGGQPHCIIVNKNTGDYRIYQNAIGDPYELDPAFHGANDEYFIRVYPSLMIGSFIEKGKQLNPEHPDYQNYKVLVDTKPTDNPIIAEPLKIS